MKAIIPLAGLGSRLRPHTYSKPKPLVKVAGKPILGHILDRILTLNIDEVIFVYSHMKEQIEEYVKSNYNINISFVKQDKLLGDGYAIYLTKDLFKEDEDVLIVFSDTIFEADLNKIYELKENKQDETNKNKIKNNNRIKNEIKGIVWIKEVEDPKRFGVVVIDDDKIINNIVEKPQEFVSNLALVGLYYFKSSELVFNSLDYIIKHDIRSKGEFRLADAMKYMVKTNNKLTIDYLKVWADCGTNEALLETNKYLLNKTQNTNYEVIDSVIIPPVFIDKDVVIKNSIIGPFVTIDKETKINKSIINNSIIGKNTIIENAALDSSLIGDNVVIRDTFKKINIGDNSVIDFDDKNNK